MMKLTWLGQAGLLIETCGKYILIDPYLSDSVAEIEPRNRRRVPVDERFLALKPDMIVLTHSHLDHTDPETLRHYLTGESTVTVLAPYNAWQTARQIGGYGNNYVMFNRKTRWTEGEIVFRAVHAEHSDREAVGVLITAEGKTLYVTGDTLYHEQIFEDLGEERIDCIFLPVNGKGNNMNMQDAADFCRRIGAPAVPMHCGLFDDLSLADFPYEKKIVPRFFEEISMM